MIQGLKDCDEEQRVFLVYHSIKGLTGPRIVEVFNEQFSRTISIEILEGLLSTLRTDGDEPKLLFAAADYEWHMKYLPKPAPVKATAPAPSPDGHEKKKKSVKSEDSKRKDAIAHKQKYKSQSKLTLEQQSYLAWMSQRNFFHEQVFDEFRKEFGNGFEDWQLNKLFTHFKHDLDLTDEILIGVESYPWHKPDLKEGEAGYPRQQQVRRQYEARRRVRDGVSRLYVARFPYGPSYIIFVMGHN